MCTNTNASSTGMTSAATTPEKEKVVIIGSGNWGSAIACKVGRNCIEHSDTFCEEVNMWVFEETVLDPVSKQDVKLTEYINEHHVNIKYLDSVKLPENVRAVASIEEACQDATILLFVVPHQFLRGLLPRIRNCIDPSKCKAVSLIKGIEIDPASHRPVLLSDIVSEELKIPCGALMGANVALDVAKGAFCEATLAFESDDAKLLQRLFHQSNEFHIQTSQDIAGTQICGALKNIVALGAGFCDGLQLGSNTKAALLRVGLAELERFARIFFPSISQSTFLESCGMADLITTCFSGRNRKCAQLFAEQLKVDSSKEDLWSSIEQQALGGQKLQGTLTSKEVQAVLEANTLQDSFPLMTIIYEIAFGSREPADLVQGIRIPSKLAQSRL